MKQKGLPVRLAGLVVLVVILLIPVPHYQNQVLCFTCPGNAICPPCPKPGWELGNPLWKEAYTFFSYKTIHLDPLPGSSPSPVIISTKCKSCSLVWDTTCSGNFSCVIPEGYSQGVCAPVLKMGQKYTNSLINKICDTKFSDEINNWKTYTNSMQ